jgi:hypothetical protein
LSSAQTAASGDSGKNRCSGGNDAKGKENEAMTDYLNKLNKEFNWLSTSSPHAHA